MTGNVVRAHHCVKDKCNALAPQSPCGYLSGMRQERARRIMRLLGWGMAETARRYNAVAGTRYNRQQVHKQVAGERDVSDGLAVFLTLSLRLVAARRRLERLRAGTVSATSVEAAAEFILRAAREFPDLAPGDVAASIVRRARDLDSGE